MKNLQRICGLLVIVMCATTLAINEVKSEDEQTRNKKVLGLFNVIKFPNVNCTSTSGTDLGTCYTSSECSNKGGISSGTCASGYGVCCVFKLECGGKASENNTYLEKTLTGTTSQQSCSYSICPVSTDICRIRFDLNTFIIAGPSTDATALYANGDCLTDSFSIASPGSAGTPMICGSNSGQHMILDVGSQCLTANFLISSTTASWKIQVTQFKCGAEKGGPPGCLQFFTGDSGTANIKSFNFDGGNHLSNQNYNVCVRRMANKCQICYTQSALGSFKLSQGGIPDPIVGFTNSDCSLDYISIHGQTTSYRNCGLALNEIDDVLSSICSSLTPFMFSFITDGSEVAAELTEGPNVGFSLSYTQKTCTTP